MEAVLFQKLKQIISEGTGLNLREQDGGKLVETVNLRVKLLGLSTEEYSQFLRSATEGKETEWQELTSCLTTGETYFFRDRGQFSLLNYSIIPEIIECNRAKKSLRIWSAGCSTGEEAYSIAILIDKLIPDRNDWNIFILGTDVNEVAINKARLGCYGEWSFRHVEDEIRKQYFHKKKNKWMLYDRMREMVRFEIMDLVADKYPDYGTGVHDMDLILCRNVFIYFRQEVASKVVEKMTATLSDGGYLMTGHAEMRVQELPFLKTKVFPESVVYQKILDFGLPILELKPGIKKPHGEAVKKGKIEEPAIEGKSKIQIPKSKIEQAMACADRGRYDDAAMYCNEVIKLDPFRPEPYYLLAQIAREKGDIEKEKEMLKKVIYLNPSYVAGFLELAVIYEWEGDEGKALKMRKTVLELLKKLPLQTTVEPYERMTAGELIKHVEKMVK